MCTPLEDVEWKIQAIIKCTSIGNDVCTYVPEGIQAKTTKSVSIKQLRTEYKEVSP